MLTLGWIEPDQFGNLVSRILLEDLDQTGDEEVLLLGGRRLPVIRFDNRDHETHPTSPLSLLLILGRLSGRTHEGLYRRQIIENPGLSDREGPVAVLSRFVHPDSTRLAYGDDDEPWFLVGRKRVGGRRRGRVGAIFRDANVRYI